MSEKDPTFNELFFKARGVFADALTAASMLDAISADEARKCHGHLNDIEKYIDGLRETLDTLSGKNNQKPTISE